MGKGIFVTATGTDIGKTYVTGLLVKTLKSYGVNIGYYKSALSGAERIDNKLIPGDAEFVCNMANINSKVNSKVSYVYENPVSPHLATKLEGNPAKLDVIKSDYNEFSNDKDYIVVEGSGGIVCPIRYDNEEKLFLVDIIKELKLDTIVVADAGLGTINSVVLTIDYIKKHNILVKGIILNRYDDENIIHKDNKKIIEELTGIKVMAIVEKDCKDLKIEKEILLQLL